MERRRWRSHPYLRTYPNMLIAIVVPAVLVAQQANTTWQLSVQQYGALQDLCAARSSSCWDCTSTTWQEARLPIPWQRHHSRPLGNGTGGWSVPKSVLVAAARARPDDAGEPPIRAAGPCAWCSATGQCLAGRSECAGSSFQALVKGSWQLAAVRSHWEGHWYDSPLAGEHLYRVVRSTSAKLVCWLFSGCADGTPLARPYCPREASRTGTLAVALALLLALAAGLRLLQIVWVIPALRAMFVYVLNFAVVLWAIDASDGTVQNTTRTYAVVILKLFLLFRFAKIQDSSGNDIFRGTRTNDIHSSSGGEIQDTSNDESAGAQGGEESDNPYSTDEAEHPQPFNRERPGTTQPLAQTQAQTSGASKGMGCIGASLLFIIAGPLFFGAAASLVLVLWDMLFGDSGRRDFVFGLALVDRRYIALPSLQFLVDVCVAGASLPLVPRLHHYWLPPAPKTEQYFVRAGSIYLAISVGVSAIFNLWDSVGGNNGGNHYDDDMPRFSPFQLNAIWLCWYVSLAVVGCGVGLAIWDANWVAAFVTACEQSAILPLWDLSVPAAATFLSRAQCVCSSSEYSRVQPRASDGVETLCGQHVSTRTYQRIVQAVKVSDILYIGRHRAKLQVSDISPTYDTITPTLGSCVCSLTMGLVKLVVLAAMGVIIQGLPHCKGFTFAVRGHWTGLGFGVLYWVVMMIPDKQSISQRPQYPHARRVSASQYIVNVAILPGMFCVCVCFVVSCIFLHERVWFGKTRVSLLPWWDLSALQLRCMQWYFPRRWAVHGNDNVVLASPDASSDPGSIFANGLRGVNQAEAVFGSGFGLAFGEDFILVVVSVCMLWFALIEARFTLLSRRQRSDIQAFEALSELEKCERLVYVLTTNALLEVPFALQEGTQQIRIHEWQVPHANRIAVDAAFTFEFAGVWRAPGEEWVIGDDTLSYRSLAERWLDVAKGAETQDNIDATPHEVDQYLDRCSADDGATVWIDVWAHGAGPTIPVEPPSQAVTRANERMCSARACARRFCQPLAFCWRSHRARVVTAVVAGTVGGVSIGWSAQAAGRSFKDALFVFGIPFGGMVFCVSFAVLDTISGEISTDTHSKDHTDDEHTDDDHTDFVINCCFVTLILGGFLHASGFFCHSWTDLFALPFHAPDNILFWALLYPACVTMVSLMSIPCTFILLYIVVYGHATIVFYRFPRFGVPFILSRLQPSYICGMCTPYAISCLFLVGDVVGLPFRRKFPFVVEAGNDKIGMRGLSLDSFRRLMLVCSRLQHHLSEAQVPISDPFVRVAECTVNALQQADEIRAAKLGARKAANSAASHAAQCAHDAYRCVAAVVLRRSGSGGHASSPCIRMLVTTLSPGISPLPSVKEEAQGYRELASDDARVIFQHEHNISAERFAECLEEHDPTILILSAHADASYAGLNTVAFVMSGTSLEVTDALISLIGSRSSGQGGRLRLVLINGCSSSALGSKLAECGVPYVICWATKTHDVAASLFGRAFMQELLGGALLRSHFCFGQAVKAAFDHAQREMSKDKVSGLVSGAWPARVDKFVFEDPNDHKNVVPQWSGIPEHWQQLLNVVEKRVGHAGPERIHTIHTAASLAFRNAGKLWDTYLPKTLSGVDDKVRAAYQALPDFANHYAVTDELLPTSDSGTVAAGVPVRLMDVKNDIIPPRSVHDFDACYEKTGQQLGAGHGGSVSVVRNLHDKCYYAAKTIHYADISGARFAQQEATLMLNVRHVNLLRCEEYFENEQQVNSGQMIIVTQWCDGGSLEQRLVQAHEIHTERVIVRWMQGLLLALQELHSHGIVHRDVKAANVLFVSSDPDEPKLADFGSARRAEAGHNFTEGVSGTLPYMAPEMLAGKGKYDAKVDIWSAGVLMLFCATGVAPCGPLLDESAVDQATSTISDDTFSAHFKTIVRSMLRMDATERPTAQTLLANNYWSTWCRRGGAYAPQQITNISSKAVSQSFEQMLSASKLLLAEKDEKMMQEQIALHGLRELRVAGDGNCQYRALAVCLHGDEQKHGEVRKKVVAALETRRAAFQEHVVGDYDAFLARARADKEWGDHVTLQAAADAFQVCILLFAAFTDCAVIQVNPTGVAVTDGTVLLSFYPERHYNALLMRED